jgi:hypothetical protein
MGIGIIDKLKPMSDFPVAEAPDIDVNGTRLNKVLEKIEEDIQTIGCEHDLVYIDTLTNLLPTELSTTNAVAYCKKCGITMVTQKLEGGSFSHEYGEWTTTVQPECIKDGSEQRTCSICGNVETVSIPALGHDWSEWEEVHPATCEIDGTQEHTCSRCGEVETEVIVAEGHDWDIDVEVVAPTCGEQGYTIHTCNACGTTQKTKYTAPTGLHKWGEWSIIIPPDCTVEGEEKCTCTVCGIVDVAKIPMTDHTPSDWIIDKEPTTEEEGLKHKECTFCGYKFPTISIPKLEVEDTNTYLVTESGEFLTDEQGNLLIL